MRLTWGAFWKEAFAIARVLANYPFKSSKLDLSYVESQRPNVLCIHGYLHNETSWRFYRKHLQKSGCGPVDTVYYPSLAQSIPQNSLNIKSRVKYIKDTTGRDVNIFIGHSEGGLVALEYALAWCDPNKVTYVITLGSPLHGTRAARIGIGPGARDMEINSSYLSSLLERLSAAQHVRILALASNSDPIIHPWNSALLSETPNSLNVIFNDLGHVAFLFSQEVIDTIVDYLRKESLLLPL